MPLNLEYDLQNNSPLISYLGINIILSKFQIIYRVESLLYTKRY
jgi:hypothetical protein